MEENSKNFTKILQILKFSVTLHRKFHRTTTVVESEIKTGEYMPVTHGVTGSSPVRTAKATFKGCFFV